MKTEQQVQERFEILLSELEKISHELPNPTTNQEPTEEQRSKVLFLIGSLCALAGVLECEELITPFLQAARIAKLSEKLKGL